MRAKCSASGRIFRRAIAQRRHDDREAADAEHQVLAEPAGADLGFEIAVGRGDDARVGRDLGGAADARDHLALEHAQQLGLQRERHLADLVEEQRAAVGGFEEADLALVGAGERAALVAEQLALEQRLGQRRAVELDQRLVAAARLVGGSPRRRPSLPTPVSPRIRTVIGVSAMRSTSV